MVDRGATTEVLARIWDQTRATTSQRQDLTVLQTISSTALRDGGPSRAATRLNAALNRAGVDTVLLTTNADGRSASLDVDTDRPVKRNETAIWFCERSRPFRIKSSWSMAYRVLRLARRADIIHIHGVYEAHSVYAYIASRIWRVPYVLQPHGTLEPYQQSQGRLPKAIWNRLIGHRIIRSASSVIAASESEAANVTMQYPTARCVAVPLGFDAPESEAAGPEQAVTAELKSWLSTPRERRVIFLGRLAKKKRPDLLLQAWGSATEPSGHLLIAGPPQDWDHRQLERLAGDNTSSVSFLPEVDHSTAAWLLGQAGIFVLPSENENFGIAVIEAMAHGCAVLTTPDTASSVHVARAGGGVVEKMTSPGAVEKALMGLLAAPQEVLSQGACGAEYAHKNLTWSRTAMQMIDIYRHIAGCWRAS